MDRPEKEQAVQEVADILTEAKGVFLTDYQGLNVEKISELRDKCREADVHYRVVKNTLARLAAKKAGWDDLVDHFQGPSAIAYSLDDPSAPARIITEFAKKAEKPTIKVSLFEGEFYGPEKIKMIAGLPSKEVLLSNMVRGLNAPIQNVVGVLSGLLRNLVGTLDAVRELKENQQS